MAEAAAGPSAGDEVGPMMPPPSGSSCLLLLSKELQASIFLFLDEKGLEQV